MDLIVNCLQGPHDPRLAAGAVLVCLLSAIATMVLAGPALLTGLRRVCFWMAGITAGLGAWAAHFIATLAYDFPVPVSSDLGLTLLSAGVAVGTSLAGLGLYLRARRMALRALGGAVLGGGIVLMHYIGLRSLVLPGVIVYDPPRVWLTVLLGCGIAAVAFVTLGRSQRRANVLLAALLLALAIGVLHMTGMASAILLPDGASPADAAALPAALLARSWLGALVGSVAAALLLCVLVLFFVGRSLLRQVAEETERLRGFSNAAFEAIAICDAQGRIIDVNDLLAELLQTPREALRGIALPALFREFPASMLAEGGRALTALAAGVPVELLSRRLRTSGGTRVVVALRDLRDRLAAEQRILHLARHDTLTGLPNRAYFLERLAADVARARQGGPGFSLMCLDLDRFKAVNDTHGHPAGDRVLQEAARRLRAETRQGDFVARLGGDEFIVLKPDDSNPDSVASMAARIVRLLSQPYDLGRGMLGEVSASIGIARCLSQGVDADELLRRADVALYSVKHDGRNGMAFYNPAMDEALLARQALERDIRLAIPRGELELDWQPQRRVQDDTLLGFEALLRWRRPGEGFVSPQRFMAAAEATGAIVALGSWALRTACLEAAKWASPLRISVHVSASQVQQGGFVELVGTVLRDSGLEPGRLELEVTESLMIQDEQHACAVLERIQALGVRVALDRFGTGHASFGTLRAFSFDRLKIDSSFVQELATDPSAQAVVRAILSLGQGLHMPVVAAGVESGEQLQVLKQAGCLEYQGHLSGRPQPFAAYRPLVQRPMAHQQRP